MIKLFGSVLIIAGTALCGLLSAGKMQRRVKCLQALVSGLSLMESEIADRHSPVPELFSMLSDDALYPANLLFIRASEGLEMLGELSFAQIWREAVEEERTLLLTSEEKKILCSLSFSLGRYSAHEQKKAVEFTRRKLEECAVRAERDRDRNSRVQAFLGLAAGIFTVIIFI